MKWHLKHARHGNKPWAVQAEAIRQREASGRKKYAWFMEMGLGKSAVTLNDFISSDADLAIVVCPNSFKGDWKILPAEWGIPEVQTHMWPWKQEPILKEKSLITINYEAARRGFNSYKMLERLLEKRRCMLVIDESSCIKNSESETAKSLIELSKRATYMRELNGTPLTQTVMDFFPQLRCLGEFNGMKAVIFRARFAVMGGYMGRQVVGIKNEEELQSILNSCSFRALKKDWRKDLPPQVFTTVHLEMTDKQRVHYDQMLEEFFTTVNDVDVTADMVLTQMARLQQIASCLAISGDKLRMIEDPRNNPKVKATMDLHSNGPGKSIVVYIYKASGDVIEEIATKEKLNPARIKGQMSPSEMTREKQKFNEDPSCRLLVAQESAACMGHTLIGGEGLNSCHRVIFFENSFSLRDRMQMQDRIHRGDQKETCDYFDLVISPIDEIAVQALVAKKNLSDSIDALTAAVRKEHAP